MIGYSLALVLAAMAVTLWSSAQVAGMRLAALTGRPTPGTRLWTRLTGSRSAGAPGRRLLMTGATGLLVTFVVGLPQGPVLGALAGAAVWWLHRRTSRPRKADPMLVAATWDLLAACLRAGLPVPTAITAVAGELPGDAARALRAAGDLLALGADPVTAWTPAVSCPETAALARGARRAAQSGTGLASLVADLAVALRAGASDASEAAAQRVGVLITAPLGLCFLPAFICLGIAPVVAGLAGRLPF